ncbi:alpha-1A adrenergic receptor-like [Mya arenaria]|uniref:alpha-1A adrenergic receptor-like n=1 Tax=Mya arenaria TaxID=6604 RepID=UPI0022E1D5F5|nr:alpha-1A adrenergic receptor-like [Mya arenaria]
MNLSEAGYGKSTGMPHSNNMSLLETIAISVFLGCIIMLTIFGNTTVLLAVFFDRRLRSTTNYFIVNLAAADLLLGITVLPLSASLEILKYWPFGPLVCDIWASADVLWCTASILTLCVISIDRYIGVTRPLQHSSIITKRRAGLIISLVWLLSLAISVGPLIGWREAELNDDIECTVTKQVGYVIFSVSGSFYIPMLIIMVVYLKIYREATRHNRFLNSGSKTVKGMDDNGLVLRIHTARCSQSNIPSLQSNSFYSNSSEHSEKSPRKLSSRITTAGRLAKFKREKKAAKTLGIVVGVFIICWFPFFFCLPLDVLCTSCKVPEKLFTVIFWLGYCNSLMNPIIYASSSREFKRAFIKVLKCYWCRRRCNNVDMPLCNMTLVKRKRSPNARTGSVKNRHFDDHLEYKDRSASPARSLVVYHDSRKHSSQSSHINQRLSFSDLDDIDYHSAHVNQLDSHIRNYSAMV